ncbi:MAG TPA: translocation/assembly module TamB domain-containing protein [Terriglobia bacterium]|nr:translocation/assembly module TamB domain-containing protein [Terriglobia bacterium]
MRWLIYSAGIIVVILVVIVGLASTAWFRNILQHRVETRLTQITGAQVEIAGMRFRPLRLRVSFGRLVIHGLEKNALQPLFSATDVVANVSPQSLLQFKLLLRSLQWQQAELRVHTYADGSTNFPGPTADVRNSRTLADLLNLEIERLTLSRTTLQWNNQKIPLQASGHDVAVQLHLNQDHHYFGSIASSDTAFEWGGHIWPHLSFATTFTLSEKQIEVPGLSWQIENFRGHLTGVVHWTPQLAANFEFRMNGGLQEFARALSITALESGYLYVDGAGSYDPHGISAKGRVRARDLKLRTTAVNPGKLNFTSDYAIADSQLKLPNFSLTGLGARADGNAIAHLAKVPRQLILHSQLKNLDLGALMQATPRALAVIGDFHPQAVINGTVNANWQERSGMKGRFDLRFNPPKGQNPLGLPLSGKAKGSIEVGKHVLLALDQAQLSTPRSTMAAQGTFGDTQSSLSVRFVTSDFEEWRPVARIMIETRNPLPVTLRSQAVFTGHITGTLSKPEIAGQVSTGAFNYGGWLWDSFDASIVGSPLETRIQSGRLKLGRSLLTLNADIGLADWKLEPYSTVRLDAAAHGTPVAGLRAALGLKPSMEGLLSGQIQVEGTVESLSGHGQVSINNGEFAGVPFELLSANIIATKSNWNIRDFKLAAGQGHADGSMQINPVARTFSANVQGRNFPLGRIHFLNPQLAGSKANGEISGLVSFDIQGGGAFDHAQLHAGTDITDLAWKGQQLGSLHGDGDWQGQQIQIQVKGGGGPAGSFQMTGSLETHDNWPLHLSGQYSGMRMDPWIEEFSGHKMVAAISASGAFSLQGPLTQTAQLVGSSQIQQLRINFPSLALSTEGPVEISYADGSLQLKQFRLQGPATNFEAGGSIRLGHPSALDISARGKAAATLLSLLASDVQATGESDLQLQIRGSLSEPQLSGEIQVKDVGLGYTDLPFRLNALNGTIKLEGERAVVSGLKGTIGGGTVSLAGFMVLQETPRYQIRAELSQVRVRYPAEFTSVLDGNLSLAGTTAEGQLNGDVVVRNLFASENLNLVDFISGPSPFGEPYVSSPSPFASSISLNVGLASVRPVRIETHDLRLVSDIDLRVQGTVANPVVVGNIYLRGGDAIFRGNRYTLTRGDIAMTNPFRTEPTLDLQAHTRVEKYDLTLEISGPPDQIRFSYRSDPPLPTADILSLLAFGYSRRLEEFAPEAKNPFSSAGAGALLSQALSSQMTGRIQRLFGVSRIKFSPASTELGTLSGPVLTVEQQLSPALTLTYETSTANSQYRVVEFEFTVNPRMSVRGFRDQNGIFGLELKFRKRFK